ncbi:MAG: hypothetical protein AAB616_00040, partial [Patescibacteria group bacterium]
MSTKLILETIKKAARTTDILLNIFIGDNTYKNLKRKVMYPTLPDFSRADKIKIDPLLLEKEKHKFYSLLSRLKKQGFIKKEQKRKGIF